MLKQKTKQNEKAKKKKKEWHFFYKSGIYLEAAKTRKDIVSDYTTKILISYKSSSINLILGLF